MGRAISVSASKPFGLQRACQVLGFPRSTIYAVRARTADGVVQIIPARRGPKPKMPDADLLKAIRDDLAASPFIGEGHRKVWARLPAADHARRNRAAPGVVLGHDLFAGNGHRAMVGVNM
ncbi:hypothetical protein B0G80_1442 [Paraburkholderia sp. BL6669N2]|nr:hypothetical protein B0G80_1442 [Paraburkholderia sp. BL6669N2]